MSFPEKPTCKDLSDTKELKRFPGFNSSMAATNTITDKNPDFAGQGTPSESTQDVVARTTSYVGYSHPTADLPGPEAVSDSELHTDEKGSGYSPTTPAWETILWAGRPTRRLSR